MHARRCCCCSWILISDRREREREKERVGMWRRLGDGMIRIHSVQFSVRACVEKKKIRSSLRSYQSGIGNGCCESLCEFDWCGWWCKDFYSTNFSLREIKLGMFLGIREGKSVCIGNSANSVLAHKWKAFIFNSVTTFHRPHNRNLVKTKKSVGWLNAATFFCCFRASDSGIQYIPSIPRKEGKKVGGGTKRKEKKRKKKGRASRSLGLRCLRTFAPPARPPSCVVSAYVGPCLAVCLSRTSGALFRVVGNHEQGVRTGRMDDLGFGFGELWMI